MAHPRHEVTVGRLVTDFLMLMQLGEDDDPLREQIVTFDGETLSQLLEVILDLCQRFGADKDSRRQRALDGLLMACTQMADL